MDLNEALQIRDEIIANAYDDQDGILDGSTLSIGQELQSEIMPLRKLGHWNSIAVGYTFVPENSNSVRLELRAPATSKKARTVAAAIAKKLGHNDVRVCYTNDTFLGEVKRMHPCNTTRYSVLSIGLSIGSKNATGSLGAFATDDENNRYAISCSHVLAEHPAYKDQKAVENQRIFHPGPSEIPPNNLNVIGSLTYYNILDDAWINKTDSAAAKLDRKIQIAGNSIPSGLGTKFDGRSIYAPPTNDQMLAGVKSVFKLGKSTGLTSGTLSAISAKGYSISVPYSDGSGLLKLRFDDIIEISWDEKEPFSDPGDSGGLVFTEIDGKLHALGLVFASSKVKDRDHDDYRNVTLACMMKNVLDEHNLSWQGRS